MPSDIASSCLIAVIAFCSCALAVDEQASYLKGDTVDIELLRRSSDAATTQDFYSRELVCRVDMVGLRGEYFYRARPENVGTVCAVYLLAESHEVVEVEFTEFDIDCADPSNQVQFFDGWTMGVGSFPSRDDHPRTLAERVTNVCTTPRRRVYRSHQNGAMVTFLLGSATGSFTIVFRPVQIPEPCNVIAPEPSGTHTLRNYGNERNCSLSIIYPATIRILEMGIGASDNGDASLRCNEGLDYVDLLEGNSLEISHMTSEESICGQVGNIVRQPSSDGNSMGGANFILPGGPSCQTAAISVPLMCHNSVVRLVSSGQHDNRVSFRFKRLDIARSRCADTEEV